MALQYHPDKQRGEKDKARHLFGGLVESKASATEKFRKVVEAYEALRIHSFAAVTSRKAIAGHVAEIPAMAALLGPLFLGLVPCPRTEGGRQRRWRIVVVE